MYLSVTYVVQFSVTDMTMTWACLEPLHKKYNHNSRCRLDRFNRGNGAASSSKPEKLYVSFVWSWKGIIDYVPIILLRTGRHRHWMRKDTRLNVIVGWILFCALNINTTVYLVLLRAPSLNGQADTRLGERVSMLCSALNIIRKSAQHKMKTHDEQKHARFSGRFSLSKLLNGCKCRCVVKSFSRPFWWVQAVQNLVAMIRW